jgi:type IV pilus assembly protein PilE
MGDIRTQMEKYFMDNRQYTDAGGKCGAQASIDVYNADPASTFFMSCPNAALSATTYSIQVDGVAVKGMKNFQYSVDQTNAKLTGKLPAGWGGVGNNCWVLKKDGSC